MRSRTDSGELTLRFRSTGDFLCLMFDGLKFVGDRGEPYERHIAIDKRLPDCPPEWRSAVATRVERPRIRDGVPTALSFLIWCATAARRGGSTRNLLHEDCFYSSTVEKKRQLWKRQLLGRVAGNRPHETALDSVMYATVSADRVSLSFRDNRLLSPSSIRVEVQQDNGEILVLSEVVELEALRERISTAYPSGRLGKDALSRPVDGPNAGLRLISQSTGAPQMENAPRADSAKTFRFDGLDAVGTGRPDSFQGRQNDLRFLDESFASEPTRIVIVHALGGEGKTALVKKWRDTLREREWAGARQGFGYSFYGQGQLDAVPDSEDFFIKALSHFDADSPPTMGTPFERANRLLDLVSRQKTILLLDGLEVLQYPPDANHGSDIFNQAFLEFINRLTEVRFEGLCVITTRYAPSNLAGREPTIVYRELPRLDLCTARGILVEIGLSAIDDDDGSDAIDNLIDEYDGHALALVMAGTYLVAQHAGDPRKRHLIDEIPDTDHGRHARKVLQAYEKAFSGESREMEAFILRALSLFDRPVTADTIIALRDRRIEQLSPSSTEVVAAPWRDAINRLNELRLLAVTGTDENETFDLHPLVRAYFRKRMRTDFPRAWTLANRFLYRHLLAKAPRRLSDHEGSESGQARPAQLAGAQRQAADYLARIIIHACEAGDLWDALVILVCRIDEAYPARLESFLRPLLRTWNLVRRIQSLEWLILRIFYRLGIWGLPPFGFFYREGAELHAPFGFYLGSRLQAWDLRFYLASMFYPKRDVREAPLLKDRFFASYVEVTAAYCGGALGRTSDTAFLTARSADRFRQLGLRPLAYTATLGRAVNRLLVGEFSDASRFADEAFRLAITNRQQADAVAIGGSAKSHLGKHTDASEGFARAFQLCDRLSTRAAQCYWEHVARYSPLDEADAIFREAERNIPLGDVSASDVNYQTMLIRNQMDLAYRRAVQHNSHSPREILSLLEGAFRRIPNHHYEGAAFRTETMLQHARVAVWCAIQADATNEERLRAEADVSSAERLAYTGGYRPYIIDAWVQRGRLLLGTGQTTAGEQQLTNALDEATKLQYRWALDDIDAIRQQLRI